MRKIVEHEFEYGSNIFTLCNAAGLTQETAAEKFQMSVRHFHNIRYNSDQVTAESLGRIARAFKIAPATLGVFTWPDEVILALLRSSPAILTYTGQPLDIFGNIALLRKSYGLTQRQLSMLSEVSVATIRNIEHGYANFSISTLHNLAKAFATSMLNLAVLTTPESDFLSMVHAARAAAGISVAA